MTHRSTRLVEIRITYKFVRAVRPVSPSLPIVVKPALFIKLK